MSCAKSELKVPFPEGVVLNYRIQEGLVSNGRGLGKRDRHCEGLSR